MAELAAQIDVRSVTIGKHSLEGFLSLPDKPIGVVIFAHGSGSSRFSPRNGLVADQLAQAGFAILLFDLLSPAEATDRSKVFNVLLLAERVTEAIKMVRGEAATSSLRIGLFGGSTGAAAALVAAAKHPMEVVAIVTRGGRPDLAWDHLAEVRSPTMLIVGEADVEVLGLNRAALEKLTCTKGLTIVRGATHLFEEEGALEQVVEEASFWFRIHLGGSDVERF